MDSSFSTAAVVTALDANNNPVIGAIITADRDPATGSGTLRGTLSAITSNSGQATFSNLGYNKTDVFKVRFTSNNKTIISTQLGPLSFGAAASLNINTAPLVGSSVDTSFSTQPVISAIDQFGNPVSGAVITASRVTGTGVLRGNLTATTATNTGLATFANLGYNKSGESFTIRFTDGALYINSGSLGPISSGAPNQIRVETAANGSGTVVPAQNVSTGSSITIYAITRDQYGNFVANAAGTWSLTSITGGVVTGDLVPSGDTKSAVFTGHLAGTAVIQVTSGFLTNMPSGTLTVTAAGATKLSVSGYASPATAGTPGSITVTAQDSSGNTITTYAGTVHFTSTGSQAALPANYTFVSGDHGTHSFNVTLKTSGSQSITATDTVTNTITGTQSAIIINPAAPSQIGVETAANGNGIVVPAQNVATGNSLTVYAVTRDQYGNFVANATGTWSLINKTNGITDSDIVPSIDSKSAVLTGHLVGTAVIHLAVNGLASIDSGTITMVVAVAVNAPATVEANNYQFNVPINISQVSNFYRCQFDVMFDSTVLQYVSTTWGQIGSTQMSGNGITSSSSIAAGDERFLVNLNALSSGISGSGTIATIRFQVIGNLGQGSTINLANDVLSDFSGNSIPAIWINGSVQVSVIPGDANGDGVVNILDMTKCAREILGLDPLTPGADANGDGVVNVLDLTKIARIILGLDP